MQIGKILTQCMKRTSSADDADDDQVRVTPRSDRFLAVF